MTLRAIIVLFGCFQLIAADSVTYPGFGTFTDSDFKDTKYRPIDKVPESPEKLDPTFLLYTRNTLYPQELKYNDSRALLASDFRSAHKTKVIVHGFQDNTNNTDWMDDMRKAFLKYGDVNVVVVDWRNGNGMPYSQAVANTRIIGMMVGKFVEMVTNTTRSSLDSFHLIGHSLGAHIVGYAGKYLKGNVAHITGLDPAGPMFEGVKNAAARLWYTDGQFVEAIHTDIANLIPTYGLGMNETCAHVDVIINGGKKQPGCKDDIKEAIEIEGLIEGVQNTIACDHQRARAYYTESILNQQANPKAYMCSSYDSWMAGNCTDCGENNKQCFMLGPESIGYKLKARDLSFSRGQRFFISTDGTEPYFKHQTLVEVKLGPDNDLKGKFVLNFTYANGVNIEFEFQEKSEKLEPNRLYRKIFVLPLAPESIAQVQFKWVRSGLLDGILRKKLHVEAVELTDLSTDRNIRSPITYRFVNPKPQNGIKNNKEKIFIAQNNNRTPVPTTSL